MKRLERTPNFNKWLGLSSEYMNEKSLFNVLSSPQRLFGKPMVLLRAMEFIFC